MILIAIGSSLPFCGRPPQEIVAVAIRALHRVVKIESESQLYSSPAWPDPTDPCFVNAVLHVKTSLCPKALLLCLHAIEAGFGRTRDRKNAPRTLDLDLIAYNSIQCGADEDKDGPVLPHPRMTKRDFVLAPLAQIAPDWRHPEEGLTAAQMLARLGETPARPWK